MIDAPHDREAIVAAVRRQIEHGRYPTEPIYGDGRAGERIADVLSHGRALDPEADHVLMEALGLIPARGGSRGIPGKNLALARRASRCSRGRASRRSASDRLARIVVSTDSPEIAAAARELGVEVIDRPAALAADETPMLDVVQHALDQAPGADPVVLLQPTSPLRRSADIDAALELWEQTGADSVVSVVRVPHSFTPGSQLLRDEDGRLEPYPAEERAVLRQEKPALYARNGPAVLVVRAERRTRRVALRKRQSRVRDGARRLDRRRRAARISSSRPSCSSAAARVSG